MISQSKQVMLNSCHRCDHDSGGNSRFCSYFSSKFNIYGIKMHKFDQLQKLRFNAWKKPIRFSLFAFQKALCRNIFEKLQSTPKQWIKQGLSIFVPSTPVCGTYKPIDLETFDVFPQKRKRSFRWHVNYKTFRFFMKISLYT